jgi:hypothetical protein
VVVISSLAKRNPIFLRPGPGHSAQHSKPTYTQVLIAIGYDVSYRDGFSETLIKV